MFPPQNSIAFNYYNKINPKDNPEFPHKKGNSYLPRHYKTLYNVVMESDYIACPKNSILFHLRLYDWFSWGYAGKTSIKDYEDFIEKNKDLISNIDNIFLLYGGCPTKYDIDHSKTNEFIDTLTKLLKKYNSNVFCIVSNNTDQDFKYMVTSEYYVPSLGGYGNLAAAINKNKVYWEISEKYRSQYKGINDYNDIAEFKTNYMNNKK
jgi:hypothetical protein